MKKNCLIFLFFILSQGLINAQEDTLRWSVGLFFDYNYLIHSADFKKLPDCPSCSPGYEEGSGLAPAFGLLFEYPLNQSFVLGLRANYFNYGAELKKIEGTTVIVNGVEQLGEFEHSITASLASIGLEPFIKYRTAFGLNASIGMHFGSVMNATYEQYEKIVTPADKGTFTDSTRIHNELSGDITNANSLNIAFFAILSYELPLNHSKTLILEPELRFNMGLLPIVDAPEVPKWDYMAFGGGLAIKYSPNFEDEKQIFEEIEIIDTLIITRDNIQSNKYIVGLERITTDIEKIGNTSITKKSIMRTDTIFQPKIETLECSIYAVAVDTLGKEYPNPKFLIEEFISNRVQPLLPYIFFDDNSSDIASKYRQLTLQEKNEFDLKNLYNNSTLETYYELLNIIGHRLTQNPSAKLTITGCNADIGQESGNKELSTKRAEIIKNYLVNVWEIDKKRLNVAVRNLPSSPSLPNDQEEKNAENRRVEFSSDSYKIIEPIFLYDTLRNSSPPLARFYPNVKSSAGIAQWNITAKRSGGIGIINFDTTMQGALNNSIDWEISSDQKRVPIGNEDLEYVFSVTDNKGNKCETEKNILPIEYISIEYKRNETKNDKEFYKYSLILFDFDDYKIYANNQAIIDFIKTVIKPNSELTISGYR